MYISIWAPDIHTRIVGGSSHCVSLASSSLPIGQYADIVAINTRCDDRLCVFKHLNVLYIYMLTLIFLSKFIANYEVLHVVNENGMLDCCTFAYLNCRMIEYLLHCSHLCTYLFLCCTGAINPLKFKCFLSPLDSSAYHSLLLVDLNNTWSTVIKSTPAKHSNVSSKLLDL